MSRRVGAVLIGMVAVAAMVQGYLAVRRTGFLDDVGRHRTDYTVYEAGGEAALKGTDPYDAKSPRGWFFNGLPLLAIASAPFALLPTQVGATLCYAASLASLLFAAIAAARCSSAERGGGRATGTILLAAALFGAWPLISGLSRLNPSSFSSALIIAATVAAARGRPIAAGISVAAAAAIKAFPILLPPLWWIAGFRKSAVCAALALLVIVALPTLRYGFDGNVALLGRFVDIAREGSRATPDDPRYEQTFDPRLVRNQSLAAIATRLFVPDASIGTGGRAEAIARCSGTAVGLLWLGAAAFFARAAFRSGRPGAAAALLVPPLAPAAPFAWTHYFGGVLVFAAFACAAAAFDPPTSRRKALRVALIVWLAALIAARSFEPIHGFGAGVFGLMFAWVAFARVAADGPADGPAALANNGA